MIDGARRVTHWDERAASQAMPPALWIPRIGPTDLRRLAQLLGSSGYAAAQEMRRPGGIAPLEDSHPRLQSIRRLFWLGHSLSLKECNDALAPITVGTLIDGGFLQEGKGSIRAPFQIQVYDGLLFIADWTPREQPEDTVLPIGPSSKYLARVTIRRPTATALDMGCGCGVQALLISRFAERVTATDINPRAVALTRLNAELNGITNVETLQGSFFEPVGDRRFDLVVANLPYVISPEKRYAYRDLGGSGDLLIRQRVEALPLHLTERGYGQYMLNWIHAVHQPWWMPIEDWTKQRNADGWLLYSHSQTPEEYTRQWITVDEEKAPEEYARATRAWLDWYSAQDIERIGFGILTLRGRRAPDNWRCSVRIESIADEPLGAYIHYLFEMQDHLAGIRDPSDLLGRRLRPRLMKVESPAAGKLIARTTRGFLIRAEIHAGTAQTIPHLEASSDLRTAIQSAARGKAGAASQEEGKVCREIYQLMNLGMIEPA